MKLIFEEAVVKLRGDQMTEQEFYDFCMDNAELPVERDKDGNILTIAPTNFESGRYESAANLALGNWKNIADTGYVLSSSTGFTLPNGAVRSPDAAWVSRVRIDALPKGEREKFAHICPDFVLEIRSKTDRIKALRNKMDEYIENGAQLGFLIDPIDKQAYIYRKDGAVETVQDFNTSLS